jgi:t-SNARE complex subunit (syntaxin)
VSLSGRPKSAFRFWTTISADAATSRDSEWLEGQQRKARQRTWMCWLFWMVFLVVVVGAVVTVVVLRGKGII